MPFSNSYAQTDTTRIQINEVTFKLPGKWENTNTRKESGQYWFLETDTKISIGISARKPEKMEFYKPELKGFDLVEAYYKWDSEYWSTAKKVEVRKIAEDKENVCIGWAIKVPEGENIFLFGLKSGRIINISIDNSNNENKMKEQIAIDFLKSILLK